MDSDPAPFLNDVFVLWRAGSGNIRCHPWIFDILNKHCPHAMIIVYNLGKYEYIIPAVGKASSSNLTTPPNDSP
jgi:hypothetical protein